MGARKAWLLAAAAVGYAVAVTACDFYAYEHPSGLALWHGAFSLASALGFLRLVVCLATGVLIAQWWALALGLFAIPEYDLLVWLQGRHFGDGLAEGHLGEIVSRPPVSSYAGQALYLAAFIAFGVMTRKRELLARRAGSAAGT
jgi:hypothetical protein